jgi:glycosyltransferase involved in cell wall biosynthesis
MQLRIVHAIHSGGFYGAEKVVFDLCKRQREVQRVEPVLVDFVDVGSGSSELGRRLGDIGIRVIELPTPRGASISSLWRYARIIRELGPSLVHSHGYKPTFFHVLTRALQLQRASLLVTAHGYSKTDKSRREQFYRILDLRLLAAADRVVAVSEEMRGYLSLHNKNISAVTVRNGVDPHLENRHGHPLRSEKAFDGKLILGSVGRLVALKNHEQLIGAYAEVRRELPNCRLIILGDGPLRAQLERTWRELIPDEAPQMPGFKNDVHDWVEDFDVFCMPSQDGEGLPIALLEAGLLSKAVVVSASGGIREIIKDRVNGRLVPIADTDALVRALRDVLANASDRARYGTALRETILADCSMDRTEQDYFSVYSSILGRRK